VSFSECRAQWNKRHKEALVKKKTVIIGTALAAVLMLGGTGAAVAANNSTDDDSTLTGTTLEKASKAALAETGGGRVTDSEADDGGYEVEVTLDNGRGVELWLDESFSVLRVDSDDAADDNGSDDNGSDGDSTDDGSARSGDDDSALTAAERASAEKAALATVPGTVTEVDRSDDDDHAFEVEVAREDGSEVEVELDEAFAIVHIDEDNTDDGAEDDN
jgi:uncharacterized membrane protein YkoI